MASLVSLTQAIDTFLERAAQGAMSCIAVGPAWASDDTYLTQALQQVRESTGVLIPERDLKLAHFIGAHGLTVFETYNEQSDWPSVIAKLGATLHQLSPQPAKRPDGGSRPTVPSRGQRKQVVFSDPVSKAMLALVQRVAQVDVTALLSGPSGVGKEVVAQILHNASARATGPFIALNCSAMPEHLVESILFGHIKGSFTGAVKDQPGIFEEAHQGTLFLDEVGELPLHVQPKLLRVIQERKAARLGTTRETDFDVRLVAATNRDLVELVKRGEFREDLLYRLNAFHIGIPPLRERPEDIEALSRHFLQLAAQEGLPRRQLTTEAAAVLAERPWRGNVRELKNFIFRLALLAREDVIDAAGIVQMLGQETVVRGDADEAQEDLELAIVDWLSSSRPAPGNVYSKAIAAFERPLFAEVLRETGGNQLRAAQQLGINRNTLRKRLTELEIKPEDFAGRN